MWAVAFWILVGLILFIKVEVSVTAAILGGGLATFILYMLCLCIMAFDGVD